MASSYFSANLDTVSRAGAALQDVSSTVRSGAQFHEGGAGTAGYAQVTHALEDFHAKWDSAVDRLTNAIGGLGQVASDAGKVMREHDARLSAAWNATDPG